MRTGTLRTDYGKEKNLFPFPLSPGNISPHTLPPGLLLLVPVDFIIYHLAEWKLHTPGSATLCKMFFSSNLPLLSLQMILQPFLSNFQHFSTLLPIDAHLSLTSLSTVYPLPLSYLRTAAFSPTTTCSPDPLDDTKLFL